MKWISAVWQKIRWYPSAMLELDQLKKENQTLWKQLNKTKAELSAIKFEKKFAQGNQESFYKNLFVNSLDAIVFHSLDGVILAVNPKVFELTGFLPDELVGRNISVIQANNKTFSVKDFLNEITLRGNLRFDIELRKKNGPTLDVEVKSQVIDLPMPLAITVLRDISTYKRAKRELLEGKLNYLTLLNAISDLVVLIDASGKMLTANQTSYSFFGKQTKKGELNFYAYLPDAAANKLQDVTANAGQESQTVVFKIELDNKIFQFRVFPISGKTFQGLMFAVIVQDITQLEKDNQKMKLLAQAVDQSANSIVITDVNGSIEYVNQGFYQASGYTPEEARGNNPRILKSGMQSAEVYQHMWKTIQNGETWRGEFCNRHKDGHLYWETVLITPIKNENGQTIHYLSIKKDISLQKKYEAELEKQKEDLIENERKLKELNATKDRFFSIIGHDLKSPFNTLMGFSNLLYDNYSSFNDEKRLEYIRYLKSASEQGFTLVTNLLDWSRSQAGKIEVKPEKLNLLSVISSVIELVNHAALVKNITIKADIDPEIQFYADLDMITTIVRNLATNAIKYTFPGGMIQFTAICSQTDVIVSVRDNGKGMPPELSSKLFLIEESISTPGTAQEKGTGLGLILCKEFVEKNNGKIWVESQVDKGSNFSFSLPIAPTKGL